MHPKTTQNVMGLLSPSGILSLTIVESQQDLKNYVKWIMDEKIVYANNTKALSHILYAISTDEYQKLMIIKVAKDAWEILCLHHEGTSNVKNSKYQSLIIKFKGMIL